MIKEKKLKKYRAYTTSKENVKKIDDDGDNSSEYEDVEDEADREEEKETKKLKKGASIEELQKQIALRSSMNHTNFVAAMEAKYGGKKAGPKRKEYEMTDKEFDEIQAKLFAKKRSKDS
jgi:hypothetical protein